MFVCPRYDKVCTAPSQACFRMTHFSERRTTRRDVTGIFFWGGKVIFPDFFPGVKCFFPVENSHFGRPKTNFHRFQKWKAKKKKKKKKKVVTSFSNVFLLPFPIFHLFFSIFTPFPFFPCLFFPDTSAKISRSEVSGGHCPPPVTPLTTRIITIGLGHFTSERSHFRQV